MKQQPPEVHNRESAIEFIRWCVGRLGMGYHPDTPFAEYVDGDGRITFSPAEAPHLDELTEQAFAFCNPYEVGLEAFRHLAPHLFEQGGRP